MKSLNRLSRKADNGLIIVLISTSEERLNIVLISLLENVLIMAETAEKPRDFISVSIKIPNLFLISLTACIYLRVATEHINLHLQTL